MTMQAKNESGSMQRANFILGIAMIVVGVFLVISMGGGEGPLEFIVLVSGPILMLAGLAAILVVFTKELPASGTILGMACIVLGAILFIHDLALSPPFNNIAHIGSGLAVLAAGILQTLGRLRTLRRKERASPPAA